ncbi:f-box domain containing protein [Grosmannia clavigera kw1407]|uniref:F-box domain containing protein n=1 Tax=Grosmannia clavigera (strain kw1407 / UAMH 11150) TaxID=655863 RepID=F0XSW2_GROCL|nr:f-box domain containing protein [Grosmannia clavigera kw1407]EFW99163.1 f-box domain containing protein [Grosmannia clavigera kw1407]
MQFKIWKNLRLKRNASATGTSTSAVPSRPVCNLIQLPAELVLMISDFLSPSSRICLLRTCRALRALLGSQGKKDLFEIAGRSQCGRATFLAIVSRDLPDKWLCAKCMVLHPAKVEDVPQAASMTLFRLYGRDHQSNDYSLKGPVLSKLSYQHVNLALKYTRLRDTCSSSQLSHLSNLTKPFHRYVSAKLEQINKERNIRCSFYPKIVQDASGRHRYLLLSVISLPKPRNVKNAFGRLGKIDICPHQGADRCTEEYLLSRARRTQLVKQDAHNEVDTQIFNAFQEDLLRNEVEGVLDKYDAGELFTGSCHKCPLDFSVQVGSHNVELCVYQDFGVESSAMELSWLLCTLADGDLRIEPIGHSAGNVCRLYGDADAALRMHRKEVAENA